MSAIYFITFILTCISAFIILFIARIGLRDYIILRAPKLISELFNCDFCLCFWINVILAAILAVLFMEINIILIPIISTPITRFLL